MRRRWALIAACLLAVAGCTSDEDGSAATATADATVADTPAVGWGAIDLDPAAKPPATLSETSLVRWDAATGTLSHHPDMFPYTLATPLFSDYSLKSRALWLPEGAAISYRASGVLELPVGTILVKSFMYPDDLRDPGQGVRLLETRVLMRSADGWESWPYLWRADGSDADRKVSGVVLDVSFKDLEGVARDIKYLVPQRNQCIDCHQNADDSGENAQVPIGPSARNLNIAGQLQALAGRGWLTGLPATAAEIDAAVDWATLEGTAAEVAVKVAALSDSDLHEAARDYLDVNCAHCHNPRGVEGQSSQLFLQHDATEAYALGVCKPPGSAGKGGFGREYDLVPGDPDASILIYRTETEEVGAMMPDIGRGVRHDAGVQILREWVKRMPAIECSE